MQVNGWFGGSDMGSDSAGPRAGGRRLDCRLPDPDSDPLREQETTVEYDDSEPCGEGMCQCHCGEGHACGCDCWRCDECMQISENCYCDD